MEQRERSVTRIQRPGAARGSLWLENKMSLGKSKDSPNKSFQAFNNHFHPY